MPCDIITEIILMEIDASDRLRGYRLSKSTCGSGLGSESLLIEFLRDRPISEIIRLNTDALSHKNVPTGKFDKFLIMKHLFALQTALGAFIGINDGGPNAVCNIIGIDSENGNIVVEAEIKISLAIDNIHACGICSEGPNQAS